MSFARGRYGVEYHPRETDEGHPLRWLVLTAISLVVIAFIWYRISSSRGNPQKPEPQPSKPAVTTTNVVTAARTIPTPRPPASTTTNASDRARETTTAKRATVPSLPPPRPQPTVRPEVKKLVDRIIETMDDRPPADRVLLERLVAGERQENFKVVADTIRRLSSRPTLADLRDPLMRRLGELNFQQLFSGEPTSWTTSVTVRRGDGRERIAREHRTTTAAVMKLNPLVKWEKLKPGDVVRVLDFPNATLEVHGAGYADLSLKNGQFFRRYYLSVGDKAKSGVYPIDPGAGTSLHSRFRELGIRLAAKDREELEMFLAPGSRIVVSTEQ